MSTPDALLHTTLLTLGEVRASVTARRIEDEARSGSYDAVVSSDDTQLSMGGGVSRALLNAAGAAVAREASALIPLRLGDVAVTSGGALPVRYILHAITFDADRNIRPTEQTIRFVGQNLFRRCESLQIRRIAIPAVGVGRGGFPVEESAQLLLASLAKHAENPTVLREVVFCLPSPDILQHFVVGITHPKNTIGAFDEHDTADAAVLESTLLGGSTGSMQAVEAPARRGTKDREFLWRPPQTRGMSDRSAAPAASRFGGLLGKLTSGFKRESPIELGLPSAAGNSISNRLDEGTTTAAPAIPVSRRLLASNSRPLVSNRYVLLEELGRGGMGVVYLSWDVVLRQVVAIKTVTAALSTIPEHAHTLRKEAALQIGLSHESIVRVLHFEPQERTVGPYIIMEYVPWASGDRWLAEAGLSGLPVRSVVSVGLRLCEALSCAHASNILHGDIKPTNVFVGPTGDRAKLADFGIAQVLGARERNALVTRLVGTPAYMAPEQRRLGAKIGPWTDVYLLARTLGEFLGGRVTKEGLMELPDDAWTEPVVPVLRRGLAPDPRERPKDAEEFAALLSDVLPAVA